MMFHSNLKGYIVIMMLCLGITASIHCKSEDGPADLIDPSDTTTTLRTDVSYWITKPDKSVLLRQQNVSLMFKSVSNQFPTINIDTAITYQQMDGFGFALTGGSAFVINKLPVAERNALLKELFSNDKNAIAISYIRISLGASDLSASVFSYDDIPSGQTDMNLTHFSLEPEKADLIPILKQILAINPKIKILASPWSPPVWMKTNKNSVGGSLMPACYDVYARYFVRYITEIKTEGIPIDAITVQNEPLNPANNPSLLMLSHEQRDFIKNNLGPAFQATGITTKIILYDHNCDHPEYATDILSDPEAAQYIDGSAFHLYAGNITALSQVHNAYPAKNLYFTEQWVGGPSNFASDMQWHIENLMIGAPRNWSKNVIEWNLASDPLYRPHTDGGCTQCEGALTIGTGITRNVSYYIVAHASKFVPAGSVRIASDLIADLPNVAYRTPEGKKVLIVLNKSNAIKTFNIGFNGKKAATSLSSGTVATFVW